MCEVSCCVAQASCVEVEAEDHKQGGQSEGTYENHCSMNMALEGGFKGDRYP